MNSIRYRPKAFCHGRGTLPNAVVLLLDAGGSIVGTTRLNDSGNFQLQNVREGEYRLQVSTSSVIVYDEQLPQSKLIGQRVTLWSPKVHSSLFC